MDAAVELFYQRGYQATGVQDIVDRAGYTKGALYHYFKSKEDLLLEIHDVFMSYGLERGREIIRGDSQREHGVVDADARIDAPGEAVSTPHDDLLPGDSVDRL